MNWGQQGGGGFGNQGQTPWGQPGQGFNQGNMGYNQGGQGFNQGGGQGFNQGGQGYNQHGHGHHHHHGQGYNQGGQGSWGNQGGQGSWGNQGGYQQIGNFTQPFNPTPGQTYKIVSAANPSFSFDASNHPSNKNKIILWQHHGNDNQQWLFVPDGQGNYSIICKANGGTLEIPLSSNGKPATQVEVNQPNNSINEKWRIVPAQGAGNGRGYAILSVANGLALDAAGGKIENNTKIIIYQNKDQINQTWAIAPV